MIVKKLGAVEGQSTKKEEKVLLRKYQGWAVNNKKGFP